MRDKANPHTSDLLRTIVKEMEAKDILSLQSIVTLLRERVFGLSILILSIPNCLPIPNVAAMSALTGIPIGLIGLHMMLGRTHLWLPRWLKEKRVASRRFARFIERAIPIVHKVEVLLHPRWQAVTDVHAQRLLGLAFVTLATMMSLPIPFGNFLPGLAMALMALGLIEQDGAVILLGLGVGAITVAAVLGLVGLIAASIPH